MGNRRLRVLISIQLQRYVSAKTRFEKSKVIDLVVEQVLEAAGPVGGFVKRDENGVWFQMTKSLARDKVSLYELMNLILLLGFGGSSSIICSPTLSRVLYEYQVGHLLRDLAKLDEIKK